MFKKLTILSVAAAADQLRYRLPSHGRVLDDRRPVGVGGAAHPHLRRKSRPRDDGIVGAKPARARQVI